MGQEKMNFAIIKLCYQFTLCARLAPKWNTLNQWTVKGTLIVKINSINHDNNINLDVNDNENFCHSVTRTNSLPVLCLIYS